uniref:CCHC-type domain-containing protein n=1 Tax=Cannabis sativa TaxID=3483 RepID=A0A803P852_CANSA
MVATRTTATKPTTRDGNTTMDDVNPPPTTHIKMGVVGDRETSKVSNHPKKNQQYKLNGANDFRLWRIRMKAFLVHQGVYQAIDKEELKELRNDKKKIKEIETKAHSAILLSLGYEVLREVSNEEIALELWEKLALIYLKKSLANKLYLKKKLYTLKMEDSRELRKHLDEFNQIILDLSNIGVKIEDEDKGILLLSSLPKSYEHFVDTFLYGKETLTMIEVKAALNSKQIQKKNDERSDGVVDSLFVKGRSDSKDSKGNYNKTNYKNNQNKGHNQGYKSKTKSKPEKQCYYCKKEGHYRDECKALKAKLIREKGKKRGDASIAVDGYESAEALVVTSQETYVIGFLTMGVHSI